MNANDIRAMRLGALGTLSAGIVWGTASIWSTASPASAISCPGPARAMARLELVFGTSRNDEPLVSEEDWGRFLEAETTPRFPAGLLRAPGQWLDRDKSVRVLLRFTWA
jgi:Protein of unknown function (DUF3574)